MIFEQLMYFTASTLGLKVAFQVVGVMRYDLGRIKLQRHFRRHPHARRYRQRPLVSVIIPTSDDERFIGRCLDSLAGSSYRRLEIIVVDSASRDATRRLVKQFIAAHPRRTISLLAKRKPVGRSAAIAAAYKMAHGELVLLLDPATELEAQTVTAVVQQFNSQPDTALLGLNLRLRPSTSLAGLYQEFDVLLRDKVRKCVSGRQGLCMQDSAGTVYRSAVLRDLTQTSGFDLAQDGLALLPASASGRAYYASEAVAYRQSPLSFGQLLRQRQRLQRRQFRVLRNYRWRLFLAVVGLGSLTLPVVLTYFIYLAVHLRQPAFLLLAGAGLAVSLGLTVWDNDQLRLRQKLRFIVLIPITYAWFYFWSIVQGLTMLSSLVRFTA